MKFNWNMAVEEIKEWNNTLVEETIIESYDGDVSAKDFHDAIWFASTKILNGLEVQVVIDNNDTLHISSGTSGYVDFKIDPVGMKLPIKCWIHTHPFGSAYFSGTDIKTVSIWEPLMKTAYVLGGREHYGFWQNTKPNKLMIFRYNKFERPQQWGDGTYGYGEEE